MAVQYFTMNQVYTKTDKETGFEVVKTRDIFKQPITSSEDESEYEDAPLNLPKEKSQKKCNCKKGESTCSFCRPGEPSGETSGEKKENKSDPIPEEKEDPILAAITNKCVIA